MLDLFSNRTYRDCEGTTRREFLKIGTLGAGAFTLPQLLAARAQAATAGRPVKDTSVVWVWLGGGPTHIETFDPKLSAPAEYRSVTGEVEVLDAKFLFREFPYPFRNASGKIAFGRDPGSGRDYVRVIDMHGKANAVAIDACAERVGLEACAAHLALHRSVLQRVIAVMAMRFDLVALLAQAERSRNELAR